LSAHVEFNATARDVPQDGDCGAPPDAAPVGSESETDDELLRRARRGDGAALRRIVDGHAPRLYALALSLLGRGAVADAEDMVQETFVGAAQRLGEFEGRASLKTWLSRILVNRVSKLRRSQKLRRTTPLDAGHADGKDGAAAAERRLDVLAMLDTLSADHREVLVLRELGGMSYREIADALGVPCGTVESRLSRARLELKERFVGYTS